MKSLPNPEHPFKPLVWAYGVTTVPKRKDGLLPATLASLRSAGFDRPRLFVDDTTHTAAMEYQRRFGLEVTARVPVVRTYANWILSLGELYLRNPTAQRYALFQDDFSIYRNLKSYLERVPYPEKGYLNLYLFRSDYLSVPRDDSKREKIGWYRSNQNGRGAVALVFNREAVQTLLTHQHMIMKPTNAHDGFRSVDGAVVTAMNKAGWSEFVHYPSLTQHNGLVSSMGNKPHSRAQSFRGEDFDALELLKEYNPPLPLPVPTPDSIAIPVASVPNETVQFNEVTPHPLPTSVPLTRAGERECAYDSGWAMRRRPPCPK